MVENNLFFFKITVDGDGYLNGAPFEAVLCTIPLYSDLDLSYRFLSDDSDVEVCFTYMRGYSFRSILLDF